MSTNRQRGVRRLIIATLVPYFGFWAFMGWVGYRTQTFATAGYIEASKAEDLTLIEINSQQMANGGWWISQALRWGVLIPIPVAIAALLAWWVYRGFKPQKMDE
jgi:hypothetical protein